MCSDEDIPDQQHVGDRAGGDGEEDVALPEVEAGGDEDADELRQAVAVAAEGDGSQAVDDQHRKNGAGQNFPEILYERRRLPVLIEDQKRYEPCQLRAEHAQGDGYDLLGTIKRLRDKLGAQKYIKTVYGIGYSWVTKDE